MTEAQKSSRTLKRKLCTKPGSQKTRITQSSIHHRDQSCLTATVSIKESNISFKHLWQWYRAKKILPLRETLQGPCGNCDRTIVSSCLQENISLHTGDASACSFFPQHLWAPFAVGLQWKSVCFSRENTFDVTVHEKKKQSNFTFSSTLGGAGWCWNRKGSQNQNTATADLRGFILSVWGYYNNYTEKPEATLTKEQVYPLKMKEIAQNIWETWVLPILKIAVRAVQAGQRSHFSRNRTGLQTFKQKSNIHCTHSPIPQLRLQWRWIKALRV